MKAIILLAGYATRMYPLTIDKPKALLTVQGKPILDHIIEQINNLPTVDKIYAVTNSKFYPHFTQWASTACTTLPIEVLDDGTSSNDNKLGAIGDIFFTIKQKSIDDDLLIIAGDNLLKFDLQEQYNFFVHKGNDVLAGKEITNAKFLKSYAVANIDKSNKIINFVEKPLTPLPGPGANIGVFAIYFYTASTAKLFEQYLQEGNNPDAPGHFPAWLYKKKDVYIHIIDGDCVDLGSIEMYEQYSNL